MGVYLEIVFIINISSFLKVKCQEMFNIAIILQFHFTVYGETILKTIDAS